jgi:hypothetical protein
MAGRKIEGKYDAACRRVDCEVEGRAPVESADLDDLAAGDAGCGGLRQYAELAQPYIAVALLRLDKIDRAAGEGLEPFDLRQPRRLGVTIGDGAPRPPAQPSSVVHRRKRQENVQGVEARQASTQLARVFNDGKVRHCATMVGALRARRK